MIKEIAMYEIDPIQNGYNKILTGDQLTALSLWLAYSYCSPNILPLWFAKEGVYAERDSQVVKLKGMDGAMSMNTVREFLISIDSLVGSPTIAESKNHGQCSIHEADGKLSYYDSDGELRSSVGLRRSEDLGVLYGIKATRIPTPNSGQPSFDFSNLSLGQI